MNRLAFGLLVALCITIPAMTVTTGQALAGEDATQEKKTPDKERKEVKQRIELNNATVEQLVGTGVIPEDLAKKIVQLREDLGGFQSYDDLKELNIPDDVMQKLRWNTTIKGIASDCTC